MNTLQTHFWAVRDYLAPVLRESKFKEHGRITPEEFVAAGDFLTYKFPTWTWSPASSPDAKYTRDFLPNEKQYLISRGVPCLRRVSQMEKAALGSATANGGKSGTEQAQADERLLSFAEGRNGEEVQGKGDDEDWLATHLEQDVATGAFANDIADIPDADALPNIPSAGEVDDLASKIAGTGIGVSSSAGSGGAEQPSDVGDIPDIDDEDDELEGLGAGVEEINDPASAKMSQTETPNKLISVRTYDCLITYDKYYQTPRMWLIGYNESGQPLKPSEIFEDVSSDYAQKTVTVEPFPHGNLSTASVHPCKHASVMKKVIERMNASVVAEQRKAKAADAAGGDKGGVKKKKGWGLGGAMKKISGATSNNNAADTQNATTGATAMPTVTNAGQIEDDDAVEVEGLRVDQYLLIFLKFMASIVPAIEIDATQAI